MLLVKRFFPILSKGSVNLVTLENVLIAAKCNTNANCSNFDAKYDNVFNAKC